MISKKEFLCKSHHLGYGCIMTDDEFKRVKKKAFEIKNSSMDENDTDGYREDQIEIYSEEEQITQKDLYLIADVDVPNFTKLGISIENSKTKTSNVANNSNCNFIEYKKAILKLDTLKPTKEFEKAVKEAIKSKDPRKLKEVTNEFGQFIPKEVILGGKVCFKESYTSRESSRENTIKAGGQSMVSIMNSFNSSSKNTNSSESKKSYEILGGKLFTSDDFDKSIWADSLRDYKLWSCIKIKNPISIFEPLSKKLRKKILSLIGKKILYTNIENHEYKLTNKTERYEIFKMDIPEHILEILQNEEAECSIFPTIIDREGVKKDIFNCQIFWPQNDNPKLIIHCIQERFRKRECKLKIRWMIIGYVTNFNLNNLDFNINFEVQKNENNDQTILNSEYKPSILCFGVPVIRNLDVLNNSLIIRNYFFNDKEKKRIGLHIFHYCLKTNHYINLSKLPESTFINTLVISNYSNHKYFGILPFQQNRLLSFAESNLSNPKFISLYYMEGSNPSSVFLKQKVNDVKIKSIYVDCNQDNCICKNKLLENNLNNLECAYFDPSQVFLLLSYWYGLIIIKSL
jgi:hypothetical protein